MDEPSLRAELNRLALAGHWPDWHIVRLILADWLEENGRLPEAAMSRADWLPIRSIRGQQPGRPGWVKFHVRLDNIRIAPPLNWYRLRGRIVSRSVLGFKLMTLLVKAVGFPVTGLHLTWAPERAAHRFTERDTGLHPLGLVALWAFA